LRVDDGRAGGEKGLDICFNDGWDGCKGFLPRRIGEPFEVGACGVGAESHELDSVTQDFDLSKRPGYGRLARHAICGSVDDETARRVSTGPDRSLTKHADRDGP